MEENFCAADFTVAEADWQALEAEIDAIGIAGDRYPADQQAQVEKR